MELQEQVRERQKATTSKDTVEGKKKKTKKVKKRQKITTHRNTVSCKDGS